MTYELVRLSTRDGQLDLPAFARAAGVHPDLVRRFVALGLLEPRRERGRLWFPLAQVPTVARIQRLRAGFALNYAALGLVLDLLDRIDDLEAALRRRPDMVGETGTYENPEA